MKLLYLHGIGSGANSRTPRELQRYFPEATILAPELPVSPREAVAFIQKNFACADDIDLVIGTSLGGFYALTLPMVKKIIVNPALYADEDIRTAIGLGVHQFFAERDNGAKEYVIDEEYIQELQDIRKQIYQSDILCPDRIDHNLINETYGLFGEKDSVVNHYEDFCNTFCAEHAFKFAGEHRLSVDEIREVLVLLIKKVLSEPASPSFFAMDDWD